MKISVRMFVSTGFGFGLLPKAPGTWGTLPAVVIAAAVRFALPGDARLQCFILLGLCLVASVVGVRLGSWSEREAGRTDPEWFVLDEIAGYFLTALIFSAGEWLFPRYIGLPTHIFLIFSFLLFRGCDIVKMVPAKQLEGIAGGWGIVLDDLAAGFQAGLLMCFASWVY